MKTLKDVKREAESIQYLHQKHLEAKQKAAQLKNYAMGKGFNSYESIILSSTDKETIDKLAIEVSNEKIKAGS